MKPLALTAALATALAGTGCISSPCDAPTLTVDWTFRDINGAGGRTCTQVGVAYVDVYVDGARIVDAAPCTDYGAVLYNLTAAQHDVVVEGLDASMVIIDRDQLSVTLNGCGGVYRTAEPGEGLLSLDYVFAPVNTCAGDFMWYSLYDLVAGQVISAIPNGTASFDTAYACGPSVQFAVPLGSYRLDWMQAVLWNGARYQAVDQICTATPFDVLGGGTTAVPVTLRVAASDCGVGAAP